MVAAVGFDNCNNLLTTLLQFHNKFRCNFRQAKNDSLKEMDRSVSKNPTTYVITTLYQEKPRVTTLLQTLLQFPPILKLKLYRR